MLQPVEKILDIDLSEELLPQEEGRDISASIRDIALRAMEEGDSPLAMIVSMQTSGWLDMEEEDRGIWLDALGLLLQELRWQGDLLQLSDALAREPMETGLDEVLNALSFLGYVSQTISLESTFKWRAHDLPLLFMCKNRKTGDLEPLVISGWGNGTPDECEGYVLTETGYEKQTIIIKQHIILSVYSMSLTEQVQDSGDEFARLQTRTSWMRTVLRRFNRMYMHIFVMSVLIGALTLAVPMFVMMVYDLVIDAHSMSSMTDATTLLMQLLFGVAIAMGAETALRLGVIRALGWFGARMQVLVGNALVGQFLSLQPSLIERAAATDQIARVRAFDTVRDFISGPQMLSILELPWAIVLLFAIGILGGWLVLVPILSVGAFVLLAYAIRKPLAYEMYRAARSGSERQQAVMDLLTRLQAVKYAGVGSALFERYSKATRSTTHTTFRVNMLVSLLEHSAHALTTIAGLITLIIGLFMIWGGVMTVGALVATMILTWRLLGIVQANCVLQPRMHHLSNSTNQINQLMSMRPEEADYQQSVSREGLRGLVEAQGIVLRYTSNNDFVIRGLSFRAEPGQLVAIMGQSGAGKSSLLKLLVGLYPPQAGNIRIDGLNISQFTPHSLRQHLSYMPQMPDFFSGTITDNLRIAAPDADDTTIRQAIEYAGAVEEISALPEGLATEIGIGKTHLPPSLAHRLSLARTYLQQCPITLMDELPFDVLNSTTGEKLYEKLSEKRGTRTIIYVSHRRDFIELADKVVWLRQELPPLVGTPAQIFSQKQKEPGL